MNPFRLPGPQFLAFYAMLGAGVLRGALLSDVRKAANRSRLPSTDYLIAYCAAGPPKRFVSV
jgi:hypothetical protein